MNINKGLGYLATAAVDIIATIVLQDALITIAILGIGFILVNKSKS